MRLWILTVKTDGDAYAFVLEMDHLFACQSALNRIQLLLSKSELFSKVEGLCLYWPIT